MDTLISNEQLEYLFDSLPFSVVVTDTDATILWVNKKFQKITGYSFEETIGQNPRILRTTLSKVDYLSMWETLSQGNVWNGEFINRHKNGNFFYEFATIVPIKNGETIVRYIAFKEDLKELKENSELLNRVKDSYKQVFENLLCATLELEPFFDQNQQIVDFVCVSHNTVFQETFSKIDLIGSSLSHAFQSLDVTTLRTLIDCFEKTLSVHFESSFGDYLRYYEIMAYRSNEKLIVMLYDISDKLDTKEKVNYAIEHDKLTGFRNRFGLDKAIREQTNHDSLSIVYLDIDRFKLINQTYGSEEGDYVIKHIGDIVYQMIREHDIIARINADDFVLLMKNSNKDHCEVAATRILKEISENPISLSGTKIYVSCSAGVSSFPEDGQNIGDLIDLAKVTLCEEKKKYGDNKVHVYSKSLKYDNTTLVTKMFFDSINNNMRGFYLVYQPQICTRTNGVYGVEVLLRWKNVLGDVPPNIFVGLAEKHDLIKEITDFVLHQAFIELNDIDCGRVSINLSSKYFPEFLFGGWEDCKERIILEITESREVDAGRLVKLKEQGFEISLDDFGTGYNALHNMCYYPIDHLKLDMSFTRNIGLSVKADKIVEHILSISKSFGIVTVAEGVENEQQEQFLYQNGCDVLQGYKISKPLRLMELKNFLVNK